MPERAENPEVTKYGMLDMQVCVPGFWSDDTVKAFADKSNECGTTLGWQIRREGSPLLLGAGERVPCVRRDGFVHIMLDA